MVLNRKQAYFISIVFFGLITDITYNRVYAWSLGAGFYTKFEEVQDQAGDEKADPYNPSISIGTLVPISPEFTMSPTFVYSSFQDNSDDSYGKYSVTSWMFLYDFLWRPSFFSSQSFVLRVGLGNVIKRISGGGGSTTVPNGSSGTSTAYKPGETSSSFSTTLNLGLDYYMSPHFESLQSSGLRAELLTFHPMNSLKRTYALLFMYMSYF